MHQVSSIIPQIICTASAKHENRCLNCHLELK